MTATVCTPLPMFVSYTTSSFAENLAVFLGLHTAKTCVHILQYNIIIQNYRSIHGYVCTVADQNRVDLTS